MPELPITIVSYQFCAFLVSSWVTYHVAWWPCPRSPWSLTLEPPSVLGRRKPPAFPSRTELQMGWQHPLLSSITSQPSALCIACNSLTRSSKSCQDPISLQANGAGTQTPTSRGRTYQSERGRCWDYCSSCPSGRRCVGPWRRLNIPIEILALAFRHPSIQKTLRNNRKKCNHTSVVFGRHFDDCRRWSVSVRGVVGWLFTLWCRYLLLW